MFQVVLSYILITQLRGCSVEDCFISRNTQQGFNGMTLTDAPTISQVLKWLRDEKNIFVVVFIDDDSDCHVTYNIFRETDCVHHHHGKYFALSEWSKCELAGIEYVVDNML